MLLVGSWCCGVGYWWLGACLYGSRDMVYEKWIMRPSNELLFNWTTLVLACMFIIRCAFCARDKLFAQNGDAKTSRASASSTTLAHQVNHVCRCISFSCTAYELPDGSLERGDTRIIPENANSHQPE